MTDTSTSASAQKEFADALILFGENLLRIRLARKLSQEALADRAGIHRTEISLYENGSRQPLLETIAKLAGALEVSIAMLLDGIIFIPCPSGGEFRVSPPPELARASATYRTG